MVVQAGTPVELFERPRPTFVGYFIGSPGMNVLPATFEGGVARVFGHAVQTAVPPKAAPPGARLEIGVRPEFVRFSTAGIPVRIARSSDTGRHRIVEAQHENAIIKLLVNEGEPRPGERRFVSFGSKDTKYTQLYAD